MTESRLLSPTLHELERASALLAAVQARHDELVLAAIGEGHPQCYVAQAARLTPGAIKVRKMRAARDPNVTPTGRVGRRPAA